MPSCQDPLPPLNMCRKRKLELMEQDLNLDRSPSPETRRLNGSPCGPPPSPEIYPRSRRTYELLITGPFEQLVQILHEQLEWKENATSFGERLELENLDVPGTKRVWRLTVKIPGRSSGMVIKWRGMLSLMNFVEESTYPICLDGWTDIRSEWRSKALPNPWLPNQSG